MPDVVIRAGLVVDGLGAPPRTADIAIRGGLIAEIGRVRDRAHRIIDADGALVVPGACALLPPSDVAIFDRNRQRHRAPGVTTAIERADSSIAASSLPRLLHTIASDRFVIDRTFLFDQGRARGEVGGNRVRDQLAASEAEIQDMAEMLRSALEAGARGVLSDDARGPTELLRLLEAEESAVTNLILLHPEGLEDEAVWEMAVQLHREAESVTILAGMQRPIEHDEILSAIADPDAESSLNELFEPVTAVAGVRVNPVAMLPMTRTSEMTPVDVAQRWRTLADAFGLDDRGRIESDTRADLNILDHVHLSDDLAEGFVSTLVAGEEIVSFDELTGVLPGRLARAYYPNDENEPGGS